MGSVWITDKDGGIAVELNSAGNLPITIQSYLGSVVSSGDNAGSAQTGKVVWTPISGKKIHLWGFILSSDTAGAIKFNMGATTIIPNHYIPQNGTVVVSGTREIWVAPSGDAKLEYTSTIAGNHSVFAWGEEV